MYQHLLKNLREDLLTFDKEDCKKVKDLIRNLKKNKGQPIKLIVESNYDYYLGYCYSKDIEPMTEWQFQLCKAELEW